jgi:glycosyltransferase involved in cell wall biosynthesis
LAPDFINDQRKQLRNIGATPVDIYMDRTGQNVFKDLASIYNLIKKLKEIDPDITFSYGIKPVVYGLWASRLAGVEHRYAMVAGLGTLYVERDEGTLKDKLSRKLADYLYGYSLPFADRVFFQNPDDIQLFIENNLISKEKPFLINGSGVDIEHYRSSNYQKDPIRFTLVSRLIKEKGIYEFVEVARKVKQRYPQKTIKFTLLGDVDSNPNSVQIPELKAWVEEGIIEWPGHVDNVKEWLEKTSVFVLPTYYREGTPKSILEAMAMSRPIITTDMPGCREAVEDGKNGFLISPKDVSALSGAMAKFIQKPSLIKSMGLESREIAVNRYDVKKVNERILTQMNII